MNNLNDYLENQTDQNFKWIVIDDCGGSKPKRCDTFIKADWKWGGENTQSKCLLELLNFVNKDDLVLFCEDDDWYHKDYVKTMREAFKHSDLIGIRDPIYYNVKNNQSKHFFNSKHSSLCSTGITGNMIEKFKTICKENTIHLDSKLWRDGGHLINSAYCIGIKGMKGRDGIGMGHTMQGKSDFGRKYFKQLIGEDIKRYEY